MPNFTELIQKIMAMPFTIQPTDIAEMLIIAYVIYHLLVWVKNTRTWFLLKGIVVILLFFGVALLFEFNTILFIAQNSLNIIIMALVVVFQPELRKALEQLGKGNVLMNFFTKGTSEVQSHFDENTIDELVKASYALGRTRTGALIVIERELPLQEYIKTGITVDAVVTSQLLIKYF